MTPLMQQYHAIKREYPQALVLFQVGDFYELFYEDARKAAEYLHIVLTKRGKSDGEPIPLCGFPRHAADHHIIKLVQGGFSLVICDQRGEVEAGKLVERSVTAVLTPGMLHDDRLLAQRMENVLIALSNSDNTTSLWAFELITGRCTITLVPRDSYYLVDAELTRYKPREVVLSPNSQEDALARELHYKGYYVTRSERLPDDLEFRDWLIAHTTEELCALIMHSTSLYETGRLLYGYVKHHVPEGLQCVQAISLHTPEDFLLLDAVTQRDLELVDNTYDHGSDNTLLALLDHAATAMGSRMIRRWILQPLRHRHAIEKRLSLVEYFVAQSVVRKQVHELLRVISDLERCAGRIMLKRATLNDYVLLRRALCAIDSLCSIIAADHTLSRAYTFTINNREQCLALLQVLNDAFNDELSPGNVIRQGYNAELDAMRAVIRATEQALCCYEEQEKAATGIQSLRIRAHNEAYGYGIEITKANRKFVPERYRLVQSLVNRDRFTTVELLQIEHDIQHAQKRADQLNQEIFEKIVMLLADHGIMLRALAEELAHLDSMVSFAQAAVVHRYVRPTLSHDQTFHVAEGRHPVVEQCMRHYSPLENKQFVANNITLHDAERLWIITGPNMGGKSTFLRQAALIAIMAQAGSFVPATHAVVPIFDRIFTRIGATDRVSEGKSTFWIEMEEVARMCREATPRSLIILDEIGRGTSTYDGMAIAQAVLEHLAYEVGCLGLCATHFHEIARVLGAHKHGVGLYHVATAKVGSDTILLHAIRPGVAEGSFGLVVAQKAGILPAIISRAEKVLAQLQN